MITYGTEILIDRPAADVFPYLADVSRHASWMGGSSSTAISEGDMRPGFRYRQRTDEGEFELEITDFHPGRSFSARTVSGPMDWTGTFEVQPEGEAASRVLSRGQIRLTGIKRLLEPFAGGEVRRSEARELARLKALVEAG